MQEKMISCLAFLRERLYKPFRPRRKAGTASQGMEREVRSGRGGFFRPENLNSGKQAAPPGNVLLEKGVGLQ